MKKIIIVLLIFGLVIIEKEGVKAKIDIGIPKIISYKEIYRANMDKSNFKITWKSVKQTAGYEVCLYSWEGEFGWNQNKYEIKKPYFSFEWPDLAEKLNVRVRAYKIANNKKVYGKWSKKVNIKVQSNGKAPFVKITKVK